MERRFKIHWIVLSTLLLASLACNLPVGGGGPTSTPTVEAAVAPGAAAGGGPTIVINSPPNGSEATVGAEVLVSSTASDPAGVLRVDLLVNNVVVRSDTAPDDTPVPTFQLLQSWTPDTAGAVTLSVIAYNASGAASAPATINVTVKDAPAGVQPTATSAECRAKATTDVNKRNGPGTNYNKVGVFTVGSESKVNGHNGNYTWWQLEDGSWVSASYTTTTGDCTNVPQAVYGPPPPTATPTATYTPTPTNTPTPTLTPTPTETPTTGPELNFTAGYAGTWMCGTKGRVSFKIENTGAVKLGSLQYEVQGPPGTYLNGAMQNRPFRGVPPIPHPDCTQEGAEAIQPGDPPKWIHLVLDLPAGGTQGRAILKFCELNDLGGTCREKTIDFTF